MALTVLFQNFKSVSDASRAIVENILGRTWPGVSKVDLIDFVVTDVAGTGGRFGTMNFTIYCAVQVSANGRDVTLVLIAEAFKSDNQAGYSLFDETNANALMVEFCKAPRSILEVSGKPIDERSEFWRKKCLEIDRVENHAM